MAMLKPHFQLTPLIGASNLVGVSSDEDNEHLVVTLGSNMVSVFHVYSQKAIRSWATLKPNKFTAPVVFTSDDGSYCGVINHKNIRKWTRETSSLDTVKTYGFLTPIHRLFTLPDGRGFIQYSNGYSELLQRGIETRKEEKPSILDESLTIYKSRVVCINGSWINLILCECKKEESLKLQAFCVRLSSDFCPESHAVFTMRYKKGVPLLGADVTDQVEIIAYWADGKLLIQNALLGISGKKVVDIYKLNRFSPKVPVSIAVLDKRHVLMYGADISDEGGLVVMWDTKFGIADASRKLKSVPETPSVYCLRDSSQVLLPVGGNLIVLPYEVKASKLAAVFAKKSGDVSFANSYSSLTWGSGEDPTENGVKSYEIGFNSKEIRQLYHTLEKAGTSSELLLEQVVPHLIKEEDITGIISLVDIHIKMPERFLVSLLDLAAGKLDTHEEELAASNLLDKLLLMPFQETVLIKPLRKVKLRETVNIMEFILSVLKGDRESNLNSETAAIWLCILLDAHFTQLAICQDEKVKRILNEVNEFVDAEVCTLESLRKAETILETLKTVRPKQEQPRNHFYTLEVVQLY
ncbi:uncharacterized protein LOC136027704 [Artemia franciscana]|uniref:Nucleolar protein 11 n=1 Tax=Artemia franciscana TaxID=6661 RepID=A0AA88IIF4_ARTSF|nr:hypothetical protein QYM36_008412 [Artemia franciscana]